jgi:uncharacterized membrane protein YfcA
METLALIVALGVFAGVLTTVAGLGGGMLLLLTLALVWDPARALACTAPALLVGNLHRVWMFRDALDRQRLSAFALGAVPGAIVGGLLAASVEAIVVHVVLVATTIFAVLRAVLRWDWRVPTPSLAPAGAVVGALTGTSGGAGLLVAPVLLSTGLTGTAYIATVAGCAVAMHAGRIVGYAAGGLFTAELLALAAVATVAIVAGNLLGKRLRDSLKSLPETAIEHGVLVVCVTLALVGVGR